MPNADWPIRPLIAAKSSANEGAIKYFSKLIAYNKSPTKLKMLHSQIKKASIHASKTNRSLATNTPALIDTLPTFYNKYKLSPLLVKNTLETTTQLDSLAPCSVNNIDVEAKSRKIIKHKKGSLLSYRKTRIMNSLHHNLANNLDFNQSQKLSQNLNNIKTNLHTLKDNSTSQTYENETTKCGCSYVFPTALSVNKYPKASISYSEMENMPEIAKNNDTHKNCSNQCSKRGKSEFEEAHYQENKSQKLINLINTNCRQNRENFIKFDVKKLSVPILFNAANKRKLLFSKHFMNGKSIISHSIITSPTVKKTLNISEPNGKASKRADNMIKAREAYNKLRVNKKETLRLLPQLAIKSIFRTVLPHSDYMFVTNDLLIL